MTTTWLLFFTNPACRLLLQLLSTSLALRCIAILLDKHRVQWLKHMHLTNVHVHIIRVLMLRIICHLIDISIILDNYIDYLMTTIIMEWFAAPNWLFERGPHFWAVSRSIIILAHHLTRAFRAVWLVSNRIVLMGSLNRTRWPFTGLADCPHDCYLSICTDGKRSSSLLIILSLL